MVILIVAALGFVDIKDICAHSPHDPIDAIAISPTHDQDRTLFIAISDQLLRSTDGGFEWKQLTNGLDHKNALSAIQISPSYHLDKTMFVSSKGDGIYRSQDGGNSWTRASKGLGDLGIGLLSVYPGYHSDKIVLAAGTKGGLYRTRDGGDNWDQVIEDGTQITAVAFSQGLGKDYVVAGSHQGALYLSTDSGDAWRQIYRIPNAGALTSIAVSPSFSSDNTFFVGTEKNGVFKTVDSGKSLTEVNQGLPFTVREKYGSFRKSPNGPVIRKDEKSITFIAMSPDYETDSTVFASTWNQAVFRSSDGGNTWKRYPLGLTCDSQADIDKYKSPHFRNAVISPTFGKDGTVFLGGFDGLFRSTDRGRHWIQMETLPVSLIKGLALSPEDRYSLSIAITTYGGGAYTTDDQGAKWNIHSRGLETTRLSDVVFSPVYHSDSTLFSASRGYLLRSTDRGHTWVKTELDYTKDWTTSWRRRISSVLKRVGMSFLSPQVLTELEREKPFATVLALSPDFASDNVVYFGTRYHGIFRSVDGGLSTSIIWDAMGRTITSLEISPGFASDRTLFASIRGTGVFKTVDGGSTWHPVNDGLTLAEMWLSPTAYDIVKEDIHLVISPDYPVDATVFAASSEGLFKTTDGGNGWQKLEGLTRGESDYIMTIAVSPNYADDRTLIASVKGIGLFKTGDGGETFVQVGPDLIDSNHSIEYMAFSAAYASDNTVCAASDEDLFISTDGGNTWQAISRPARYENMREVWHCEGQWSVSQGDDYSAGSVTYSDSAHDTAILDFVGTGFVWIGTQASDQGIARVYVDGRHVGDVDQFGAIQGSMVRSYSITDLNYGPHTVMIEVTGSKNPESAGDRIEIDAFDIIR